jgi:hypothetical protein
MVHPRRWLAPVLVVDFPGHGAVQRMFDGAFVAPAVERAWRQARGEPDDETAPTDR